MRKLSTPLMLAACLSLVALQMSGLHMHVNADGLTGAPQGTHVHDAHRHDGVPASHDHGHEHAAGQGHTSDTDVSFLNYNTGVSKLPLDLLVIALVLLMFVRPAATIAPVTAAPRPLERYERWRPPNRAPPFPIS